jgi:hypothetical protein
MANWKKVVVSGSNVSQLNNDAGYLTSVTAQNAFTTASYDGTNLLADSSQGILNFASSSTQGLTISANAGTDTLTFGLAAIPNNSLANSAITIAGTSVSLGGSITQATILAGSGVFSGSAQLPAGLVSGSAQVISLLPSGTVSGSSQINYSGISGVPSGIISGSGQVVLSSPAQGEARLTINGVAQSIIDLGLQTTDNPSFAGVTAGNITVGVSTDNTITTTTGDLTINSAGGNVTIPGNLTVSSNLTVIGTASFQNTTNLEVTDRFILMASGSNTTGDGGIVVQQATQNVGELFGWDSGVSRWAVTSSFSANTSAFTPEAFMAAVVTAAGTTPTPASRYNAVGNIYVSSGDESIWIYS